MVDKDKLIIIYYCDFNPFVDIQQVIKHINDCSAQMHKSFDDTVKIMVIPTFKGDGNNHIEYINQEKLQKDEIIHIEECLKTYENLFLIKNMGTDA